MEVPAKESQIDKRKRLEVERKTAREALRMAQERALRMIPEIAAIEKDSNKIGLLYDIIGAVTEPTFFIRVRERLRHSREKEEAKLLEETAGMTPSEAVAYREKKYREQTNADLEKHMKDKGWAPPTDGG